MVNPITIVNSSVVLPPAPNTLQGRGALISVGGTTKAAGTLTLLTQTSDLTVILAAPLPLASLAWSGGTVTATTAAPHGFNIGDTVSMVISGATPTAYNGTFNVTITSTTAFTYPLTTNPGAETVPGSYVLGAQGEILSMVTTFFAQGSNKSVYVLELGEGTPTEAIAALTTWMNANPALIYSYLVPREWDGVSAYLTLVNNYTSTAARTYFFTTTTSANYAQYAGIKSVVWMIEAPTKPSTEFSLASFFHAMLSYAPSSSNQVTPSAFTYLYGVTPYPLSGNGALLTAILTADGSYVGTGAEGGISTSIVRNGTTADGAAFNNWYAIDWTQINVDLAITNAVINGSNNALAPLYYNQNGINQLQNIAASVLGSGVSYGMLNGTVTKTALPAATFAANYQAGLYNGMLVVNADPYNSYTVENPNDYAIGKYAGLAAVITAQNGFTQIVFNLTIVQF